MRLLLILLACICGPLSAMPAGAADGLRVIIVDGDEAANIVANKIAAEPVIEVRDRDDRRVANAVVRFLIRKTARNRLAAVFRNMQGEMRTLTDAAGRASANLSPLEPGSFEIEIQVSYQGETGKAVIRQTNYPTAADAKAAGREPGKSNSSNAQTSTTGATGATSATAATAAATSSTATTAAVSAGGGMSKLAVVGLVAGGAAGAGAAVVLSQREADRPPATVAAITASQAVGVQAATPFSFSIQATGFDASSLAYNWEFGDGATSSDPAPTHVYELPGAYTVVVTVRDGRQSARSEMSVTVYTVSGAWLSLDGSVAGPITLQLTQSGSTITGGAAWTIGSTTPPPDLCPVTGSAQVGTPAVIVLSQPSCSHPLVGRLVPVDYRLTMVVGGQTLSGTRETPGIGGGRITFNRQ